MFLAGKKTSFSQTTAHSVNNLKSGSVFNIFFTQNGKHPSMLQQCEQKCFGYKKCVCVFVGFVSMQKSKYMLACK